MNINQKLNSIVRLCLYISLILFFYKKNINYFYIFLSSLVITYLIFKGYDYRYEIIKKSPKYLEFKKNIVKPTKHNPFMNVLLEDYNKPLRTTILENNISNKKIKKQINQKFNHNLYSDINDVFNKNNSQRQFYTTPITTIPNNQDSFSKWLYKTGPTCKEGNGIQCNINNYIPLYTFSDYR